MLNLTPHAISVFNRDTGETTTYQPSGTVARVETVEEFDHYVDGIQVVRTRFDKIVGLPESCEPCIVSGMVLERCVGMGNIYAPDTGKTCIRNEKGHIVAVTQFRTV